MASRFVEIDAGGAPARADCDGNRCCSLVDGLLRRNLLSAQGRSMDSGVGAPGAPRKQVFSSRARMWRGDREPDSSQLVITGGSGFPHGHRNSAADGRLARPIGARPHQKAPNDDGECCSCRSGACNSRPPSERRRALTTPTTTAVGFPPLPLPMGRARYWCVGEAAESNWTATQRCRALVLTRSALGVWADTRSRTSAVLRRVARSSAPCDSRRGERRRACSSSVAKKLSRRMQSLAALGAQRFWLLIRLAGRLANCEVGTR
jgi:hypothetical protein